jgi:Zn-finger protein
MGADNGDRVLHCTNCHSLLRNSRFQQALRKLRPKDENFVHINKRWRPSDKLVQLFGRVSGLREIIEELVCIISPNT